MKYAFHFQPPARPALQPDLARLLSILRERESALVIMLEEKQGREWERPAWLLKECEYQEKEGRLSREIRSLVLRWVLLGDEVGEEDGRHLRSFWVKAKMIIKMSLERLKLLDLLNYSLFEQYEGIIDAINQGYDRTAGISHYRDIEEMIRSRNRSIHEHISRGAFNSLRPCLDLSVQKRDRECPSETKVREPVTASKPNKQVIILEPKPMRRPMSQHARNNHLHPKHFLLTKKIKKIEKLIGAYEQNIGDLMGARVELSLDNKKTLQQNIETLVDGLMQKNISNHKAISKFIFSHSNNRPVRLPSKRILKPTIKKMVESQTPKPRQAKKKLKGFNVCERAVSAKLKRKEPKLIHRLRQSQMLELQGRGKLKKLFIR